MRLALIANPTSGGGTDPEALAERLRAHGADVRVHAPDGLDRVELDRPERLAVASGDGSIARVAALAAKLDVPLAVIPSGTANDFARAHGLPRDVEAACALAATGEALRSLELGRLSSGRPFLNVASAGLATAAAERADSLKRGLGALAYVVGAAHAGATEDPLDCAVLVDDAPLYAGSAWQVIVAVSGRFGGGSSLGTADPHDGLLDVAVVPGKARPTLLRRAAALRRGVLHEHDDVPHARGSVVELHAPAGTKLNVDGEIARAAQPERFTIAKDAFRLVAPAA